MNNEIKFVSPFKKLCITVGNLPTAYIESMSYYEALTFLVNYLSNNVIPALNNNGEAVKELQDKYIELKQYVDDYFENLDVQEEINNKLDEMVEDGTFQQLLENYIILDNMTVKIPTDYSTIEEAINDLSYKNVKANKEIIILIEENHKLTKGLKLINGDYSHYRIKSENDYIVKLSPDFVGYNGTDDEHPNTDGIDDSLFVGINCTFPIIDCIFDMENNFGDGIELYISTGYINNGAGIINAGRYGCYAKDSSKVFGEGSIWSGSNSAGIRLQHTTCGTFNHSVLDGCCQTDNTLGSVYISKQSLCQIRESQILNNLTSYALLCRRSRVDIEETEITNCYGGIRGEGGAVISAENCELDGILTTDAIESVNSIIVGGKSSNCAHKDFYVRYGGLILDAQKSSSLANGVAKSDCRNINDFNVMGSEGMINAHESNASYSYNIQNTTNGKLVTYPRHAELILSFNKDTGDVVANANSTLTLTSSDIVIPDGYTILEHNTNVIGRGNTGGGGSTIITNYIMSRDLTKISFINTGVSSSSDTTIKSLNIYVRVFLTKN